MRKIVIPLVILASLLTLVMPVRAQVGGHLDLYALQTGTFPTMKASLDVYDEQARFVSGLFASNFVILEDGNLLPIIAMEERQLGVQLVLAVNAGPALAVQNEQAISRYDRISQFLQGWGSGLSFEMGDDLSLVVNGGNGVSHVQSPQQWVASLATYQPDARNLTPSLQILSTALDVAAAPTPRPGMKRAVLLITPMVTAEEVATLQNLAARATQLKIHVFVWVIASADQFTDTPATAIKDLAIQTGGQYYVFSGVEGLPSPEDYLAALRRTYELTYNSAIKTAGSHTLTIQVGGSGGQLISTPLTFDLDVQPPNPILVLPPEEITRQMPGEGSFDALNLMPAAQDLEIIIEFPDSHVRALKRTALYVDGQLVAENTSEPFDRFVWDLSGYAQNGQHTLQVEAVDILGLGKTSLGYPISVTVLRQPIGLLPFLQRNTLWLTLGAVVVAGVALTWILLASGKMRSSIRERSRLRKAYRDPLTQPVSVPHQKPERSRLWQKRAKPAAAHLARLKADGSPSTIPLLPLADPDTTFGNDPVQAIHILDDPSISPLHARIQKTDDGGYLLLDQKSVAGTWVNLEPVPPAGRRLQHGDVIHFGQVSFRFLMQKPPENSKPRIIPLNSTDRQ